MARFVFVLSLLLFLSASASFAGERKEYTVKRGDTLGQIIYMLGKEHVDVTKIHDWNPDLGTQVQEDQVVVYYTPDNPSPVVTREQAEAIATESAKRAVEARDAQNPVPQSSAPKVEIGIWVAVGLFVVGAVIYVSRRRRKVPQPIATTEVRKPTPISVFPLVDPDIPTLESYAGVSGNKIPIILSLKQEGVKVSCKAEPRTREGLSPIVWFDGEPNPVRWEKRFSGAAAAHSRAVRSKSLSA
jgi:hypothetical protein